MIPALSKIKKQPPVTTNNGHSKSNGQFNRIPHIKSSTTNKNQPSPLPPPKAIKSQIHKPTPSTNTNTSTKNSAKTSTSKPKSSNPNQLTIVFYGHREYSPLIGKTMDGEIVTEIPFNKIVFVQSLRICNSQGIPIIHPFFFLFSMPLLRKIGKISLHFFLNYYVFDE